MADTTSLFEAALKRLRRSAPVVGGAAMTGTVMLTLPAQVGCVDAPGTDAIEAADWAQYQGIRDTNMVSFTGGWWYTCSANTRFGCGLVEVHLKLRVRPVQGADLNWKRVGVVWHSPGNPNEQTALGNYYTTYGDGTEEWQVTVQTYSSAPVLFDAWYQDGKGNTYVDDNQGELHAVNPGPDYQIVRVEPWLNTVTVGDNGVQGTVSIQVASLDYDKGIELVGTTDGWKTTKHFGMGAGGSQNAWYWVESFPYGGYERWHLDLNLPGAADHFEYAVVYRHGVVNGAKTYAFWDNNGGMNYHVDRPVVTGVAREAELSLEASGDLKETATP